MFVSTEHDDKRSIITQLLTKHVNTVTIYYTGRICVMVERLTPGLTSCFSLRCLNASANKLEHLPPSSLSEESNSILQELYLTNNRLTDKCVSLLTGHTHLRVLHMAYNYLHTFPAR